ncbi:hypothetical protein PSP31120_01704 [Pandoraea sputorum]|nr:hypothetical protein PSP31120_01704 [Pandoraea sputorum]
MLEQSPRSGQNNIPKQKIQASELLGAIVNSNPDASMLNQPDLLVEVLGEMRLTSPLFPRRMLVDGPLQRQRRSASIALR